MGGIPNRHQNDMTSVQIFGLKNSQATRAAERFFKERRVVIQFVDLAAEAHVSWRNQKIY